MRDGGRLVVADGWRQGRYEHQRTVDVAVDLVPVELRNVDAVLAELAAGIGKNRGGVQEVVDYDRAHCVEFEVALGPSDCNGGVIGQYLDAHHDHRLALRRIDLARHDRGAGLVGWKDELVKAASRARG